MKDSNRFVANSNVYLQLLHLWEEWSKYKNNNNNKTKKKKEKKKKKHQEKHGG